MTIARMAFAAALAAGSVGAAAAEEQVLNFTLVVSFVDEASLPSVPEGRMASATRAIGVASFEDGRTAFKEFVVLQGGTPDDGEMTGYSTYTFAEGDSIHARFTGSWSGEGVVGDYEVISGTGMYQGATGTGHFEGREESWDRAELLDGSFTLQMPGT
jgi:hypothetical protein